MDAITLTPQQIDEVVQRVREGQELRDGGEEDWDAWGFRDGSFYFDVGCRGGVNHRTVTEAELRVYIAEHPGWHARFERVS